MTWQPTDRAGVSRWVPENTLIRPDALLPYLHPEPIALLRRLGLLGDLMTDQIPTDKQDPSNTDIDQLTAPLDPDDDVHSLLLGNPDDKDDDNTVHLTPQDPSLG